MSRFVASFIGTSNFFTGKVGGKVNGGYTVDCPDGMRLGFHGTPPSDASVTVALRPESIQVARDPGGDAGPNRLRTTVEQVVYKGLSTHYYLHRPTGEPLIVVRQNEFRSGRVRGFAAGQPGARELGRRAKSDRTR